MKKKEPTIKEMEKRMDILAQTVCRCKYAVLKNGVIVTRCVTCGKQLPCFGRGCMQGGHFIPRGCRCTRWESGNIYPQCDRCNGFLNGNYIMYSRYMQKEHPKEYERLILLFEKHKQGKAPKLSMVERRALYNSWLHAGRVLEKKVGEKLFPKTWCYVSME